MGASTTTFAADSLTYYNGIQVPGVITGLGAAAQAGLLYGTSSYPAMVQVRYHTGIPASSSTINLSYLKIPATATKGLIVRCYVASYSSSSSQPTILYDYTYIHYSRTVAVSGESAPAMTLNLGTPTSQSATSISLGGKNYGVNVDTSAVVYIKLTNLANAGANWAYSSFTTPVCSGYTVEWHKTGYIFFLIPGSNLGTTPTISCASGFVNGNLGTVGLETAIFSPSATATKKSTQTFTILALTASADTVAASQITGTNNINSYNLYTLTYSSGSYIFPAGSTIEIVIPAQVQAVAGRTDAWFWWYGGLSDGTNSGVYAIVSGGNVQVKGYATYQGSVNGNMNFQLLLLNKVASVNFRFQIRVYDSTMTLIFTSQ